MLPKILLPLWLVALATVPVWIAPAFADNLTADGQFDGLTIKQCGAIAASADGKWVAALNNVEVVVWDAASRQLKGRAAFSSSMGAQALAFSPDGTSLAVGLSSEIAFFRTDTLARLAPITLPGEGGVRALTFSPDGKWLAAASGGENGDYAVFGDNIYEVATKKRVKQLQKAHSSDRSTEDLAFSPDGKWLALAIGNKQKGIELYDTATWQRKSRLAYPADATKVAFFADSRQLAVGSIDRKLRVHAVATKLAAPLLEWVAHTGSAKNDIGYVGGVGVSGDGARILTASDDEQSLRVWEAATGKQQAALKYAKGRFGGFWLAADGKSALVCTATANKVLRFTVDRL